MPYADPAQHQEYQRRYADRRNGTRSEYFRTYNAGRERDRAQRQKRDSHLRKAFNITIEDYERMMAEQGGGCAICTRPCPTGNSLAVDHDHACCPGPRSCGRCIRGLLCLLCNTKMGWAEEHRAKILQYLDLTKSEVLPEGP